MAALFALVLFLRLVFRALETGAVFEAAPVWANESSIFVDNRQLATDSWPRKVVIAGRTVYLLAR
jgi:hypothetical protein